MDLGLTSYDIVEILCNIEDLYEVKMDNEKIAAMKTVDDIYSGKGFLPIACLSLCTREPLVLGLAGAASKNDIAVLKVKAKHLTAVTYDNSN